MISKKWSKVTKSDGIVAHPDPQNTLPLWEVKFSNSFFYKSEGRFGLLSKNCLQKVLSFFWNSDRNMAKIRKNLLQTHFYELTLHFDGFFHFSPCSSQNFKKRRALCVDSFLRAIQICPQIYKKNEFKNLTTHRGKVFWRSGWAMIPPLFVTFDYFFEITRQKAKTYIQCYAQRQPHNLFDGN